MVRGVGHGADLAKDARRMPVGISVGGLLTEHTLEGGQRQFVFAQFREHAPEARPGLEVIGIELDGGVVPLPGGGQIAGAVEEFCQHKGDPGIRTLGLQHGPQRLGRLDELASRLQVVGKIEDLRGVAARRRSIRPPGSRMPKICPRSVTLSPLWQGWSDGGSVKADRPRRSIRNQPTYQP